MYFISTRIGLKVVAVLSRKQDVTMLEVSMRALVPSGTQALELEARNFLIMMLS